MYEVEVKMRADHDAVRRRLDDRNAERVRRVTQVDTYYNAPHRDFAATDEALRIRRETRVFDAESGTDSGTDADAAGERSKPETTARATYKGPLLDEESKTRAEHETEVADGETMDAILGGLGFEPAATVEKEREFYRLSEPESASRDSLDGEEYTVTLDAVRGLGEFVEVEREAADEADIESVREGAYAVARELGLRPEEQIRTSYLGMLLGADGESE